MAAKLCNAEIISTKEDEAESFLEDGCFAQAIQAADEAIALDEKSLSAWLVRAAAAKALNRPHEAISALELVLRLVPGLADIHAKLGILYAEIERFEEAESHLRKAIDIMPGCASAYANLGSIYMRLERPDLAEAPSRQALAIDPNLIAAHQNLAAILMRTKPTVAQYHRDAAYRRQQIFEELGPLDAPRVLILTASGSGNVPYKDLLPQSRYTRILWYLEYARIGTQKRLPAYDFVFNAVGDCDEAENAHKAVLQFALNCPKPFLNNPQKVDQTRRSVICALLGSVGAIWVPKTRKIRSGENLSCDAFTSGMRFPLISRPVGRHGGEGVKLSHSAQELRENLALNTESYVTEFVDYRSQDDRYRKYRMIFVDRKPYPYHLAIGDKWLVHYWTSHMASSQEKRAEEEAYLRDPQSVLGAQAMQTLASIGETIDLDYAGIDFSLLPDGRLLFFEANATMLVHRENDPVFDYKNGAVDAIFNAINTMIADRTRL